MSTSWAEASRAPRVLARGLLALGLLGLTGSGVSGCQLYDQFPWQVRVPLEDIGAFFAIADTTWFEDEQTLFVFYEVNAEQGLSEASQIELTFRTDDVFQPFAPLQDFIPVHHHVRADCGDHTMCGSFSVHVELEPRQVGLQLRYHRDGELTLVAPLAEHIVLSGEPHLNRSAVVYGVFDEENAHVQWRLRHQFPAIRNAHATALGLRRDFRVEDVAYGNIPGVRDAFALNPYGYGMVGPSCPAGFAPHVGDPVATDARAEWDPVPLPLDASASPLVCGAATVVDALGEFTTSAFGQKNPETRAGFPTLQTPIDENQPVPFFLEVCGQGTSELHRAMQMQRLFLTEDDVVCIDNWDEPGFSEALGTLFSEKVDEYRFAHERDMVLVIALNRPNNPQIPLAVERALGLMVPPENEQSTPRLSGAFVFDTRPWTIQDPAVARVVLWCPANAPGDDLDAIPDTSQRTCAVQTIPPLSLGQASLSSLPILPTEPQFENFVDKYGAGQTGRMTDLILRAPTRTPTTTNVPVGDFGVVTFFNNEAITPSPGDSFSYCASEDTGLVVFGVQGFPDVFPLSFLGEVHAAISFPRYELGLFWEFPFLLHMKYESMLAAGVDLPDTIPFVVAFGIGNPAEQFAGSPQWQQAEFPIGDALTQCTRFCDHPTFDTAGVYNVDDLFNPSYAARCYRPLFPFVDDNDDFPFDP